MSEPAVDKGRVAILGLLAFVLIGSYELARPAAESLFLKSYGSERLPWAWLAVAGAAAVVVALYGRFSKGHHLLKVMSVAALICAGLATLLLLGLRARLPGVPFVLYIFKDVYVVVLIEIFWSFANASFPLKTAKWIYGLFCVMGSLGGMTMNLAAGKIAATAPPALQVMLAGGTQEGSGTVVALWALIPLFGLVALIAARASRFSTSALPSSASGEPEAKPKDKPSYTEGLRLVAASPYLRLMLALIALTQLAINLVDYSFNAGVEIYEPDTDQRTALIGQVYFAINLGAMILQLSTGPILKLLKVKRVLPGIPGLLGLTMVGFLVMPHVLLLAAAKAISKILDYSLFRAAKEMLYIPLAYEEKTQGKAVIDMLTYRVAKGLASGLVLGLVALQVPAFVNVLTVIVIVTWFVISLRLVRRYQGETTAD